MILGWVPRRRLLALAGLNLWWWERETLFKRIRGLTQLFQSCEFQNYPVDWSLRVWRISDSKQWDSFVYDFPVVKFSVQQLSGFTSRMGGIVEWKKLVGSSLLFRNWQILSRGYSIFQQWLQWYAANGVGHFIRVVRHYNKRRYSRVRAVSRPSFWAGATLCSLFIGMYWGATMEGVDWVSSQIIMLPMGYGLIWGYVYLINRFVWVWGSANYLRDRDIGAVQRGWITLFQQTLFFYLWSLSND